MNNTSKKIKLTKENILLIELQDNKNSKVKEYIPLKNDEEGSNFGMFKLIGYKIYAIYDGDSKRITGYNANTDETDISMINSDKSKFMVLVSKDEYENFFWYVLKIKDINKDLGIISIDEGRKCTEDEHSFLDEVYPEYFKNAY